MLPSLNGIRQVTGPYKRNWLAAYLTTVTHKIQTCTFYPKRTEIQTAVENYYIFSFTRTYRYSNYILKTVILGQCFPNGGALSTGGERTIA